MSVAHCLLFRNGMYTAIPFLLYIFIYHFYMPTASSIDACAYQFFLLPPPSLHHLRCRACPLPASPEAPTPWLKFPEASPTPPPFPPLSRSVLASVLPRLSPVRFQPPNSARSVTHTLTTRREEARIRDKIVHVLPHLTEEAYGYLLGEKSQQQRLHLCVCRAAPQRKMHVRCAFWA
jgi:hypothetical protein